MFTSRLKMRVSAALGALLTVLGLACTSGVSSGQVPAPAKATAPAAKSDSGVPHRSLAPIPPDPTLPAVPGYCPSTGGSTLYERITSVTFTPTTGDQALIVVTVFIANPTGCTAGNPCPEYDQSPEHVNVWIDWNGDGVWGPTEQVVNVDASGYLNINYSGNLVVQRQITIPPNTVAQTMLRANLGWGFNPSDPCTVSWTWGNVLDIPVTLGTVGVKTIEALNSTKIREVTGNVVWQQPVSPGIAACTVAAVDEPVADDIASRSFKLKLSLDGCPTRPTYTPTVTGTYSVSPDNVPWVPFPTAFTFSGWTGEVTINTPSVVGQFTVALDITINNDTGATVRRQVINKTLYVTYAAPRGVLATGGTKKVVLRRAVEFALGGTTEQEVKDKLWSSVYATGWSYRDGAPACARNVIGLVEGTTACGNCYDFSNAWLRFTEVHGVMGTSVREYLPGRGWLTKTPTRALDGQTGNARPDTAGSAKDRWYFGAHQVGRDAAKYYDPTMGQTGTTWPYFVETLRAAAPPGTFENGWTIFSETLTPAGPWGDLVYDTTPFAALPPPGSFVPGTFSATPVDDDGDGYFDALEVGIDVNKQDSSTLRVAGSVGDDTQTITNRPSAYSMLPSEALLSGPAGTTRATLRFSGEDIRDSWINGPYNVTFTLTGGSSDTETAIGITGSLQAGSFGEKGAEIAQATDFGFDADNDGLYEGINAQVSLFALQPGDYILVASLRKGNQVIAEAAFIAPFAAGAGVMNLLIPGAPIFALGAIQDYEIDLTLSDSNGDVIDVSTVATGVYDSARFSPAVAAITGPFSDAGVDTNANGRFDSLDVTVGLGVRVPGAYTVSGVLRASGGAIVGLANAAVSLAMGQRTALLSFDGRHIQGQRFNGPYNLASLVITDSIGQVVASQSNVYTTAAYLSTQFEATQIPLVIVTDTYQTTTVDTDGDGLIDQLRVRVQVLTSRAGNVIAQARLKDPSGTRVIESAQGTVNVAANQPSFVDLTFNGRRIFGAVATGDLRLTDLLVYHTFDPAQSVQVPDAYQTPGYSFRQFERWGDIDGNNLLNSIDQQAFVASFGSRAGQPRFRPEFDYDGDQLISFTDYQVWFAGFRGLQN